MVTSDALRAVIASLDAHLDSFTRLLGFSTCIPDKFPSVVVQNPFSVLKGRLSAQMNYSNSAICLKVRGPGIVSQI